MRQATGLYEADHSKFTYAIRELISATWDVACQGKLACTPKELACQTKLVKLRLPEFLPEFRRA